MIYLVYAHPYPSLSRANRVLFDALGDLPGVERCHLYERYPDFDIDVAAEQAALERCRLLVLMHPVFWYSVPGLLKHWLDQVLTAGWAYGEGGRALAGKDCLWVATTGGDEAAYSAAGAHRRPFADYVAPLAQSAQFCGMNWQTPFIVHAAGDIDAATLAGKADELRRRLADWSAGQEDAGCSAKR